MAGAVKCNAVFYRRAAIPKKAKCAGFLCRFFAELRSKLGAA